MKKLSRARYLAFSAAAVASLAIVSGCSSGEEPNGRDEIGVSTQALNSSGSVGAACALDADCGPNMVCAYLQCYCAAGFAECSDRACYDLSTDSMHCGKCSRSCATGESCRDGACVASGTVLS